MKPGNWYCFTIIKTVTIPDDQEYFLMRHGHGYNHLIPAGYYTHYGLYPGKRIRCHLDRINCLGRLFFEPENPFYSPGKIYPFRFVSLEKFNSPDMGETHTATVRDHFGMKWQTFPFRMKLPRKLPEIINCEVTRIKKGRLYLKVTGNLS